MCSHYSTDAKSDVESDTASIKPDKPDTLRLTRKQNIDSPLHKMWTDEQLAGAIPSVMADILPYLIGNDSYDVTSAARDIFAMRLVCKRWNAAVSTHLRPTIAKIRPQYRLGQDIDLAQIIDLLESLDLRLDLTAAEHARAVTNELCLVRLAGAKSDTCRDALTLRQYQRDVVAAKDDKCPSWRFWLKLAISPKILIACGSIFGNIQRYLRGRITSDLYLPSRWYSLDSKQVSASRISENYFYAEADSSTWHNAHSTKLNPYLGLPLNGRIRRLHSFDEAKAREILRTQKMLFATQVVNFALWTVGPIYAGRTILANMRTNGFTWPKALCCLFVTEVGVLRMSIESYLTICGY